MRGKIDKNPLKVPTGANRLTRAVGGKLNRVRLGRQLEIADAAAQLGISPGHYAWLEKGRITPGTNLCRRILAWMTQGVSFEGAPPLSESTFALDVKRKSYRKLNVLMPRPVAREFSLRCRTLGMSGNAMILLLVRNFLANKGAFVTLQDAVVALQEARIRDTLTEIPELRDILRAEVPLCVKAGAELTPWHAVEEPPIQQIVDLPLDSVKESVASLVQEEADEDAL